MRVVRLFICAELVAAAERNLAENTGFLARLAWSDDAVSIHFDKARQGAAFLLIQAPGDTERAR